MKIRILILALFLGLQNYAQTTEARAQKMAKLDALSSTVENQFKKIYGRASSYKEFKLIKGTDFVKFQKSVLDSISKIKNDVKEKQAKIIAQQATIESLNIKINSLNTELNEYKIAKSNEDNTNIVFFSIMGGLLLGLLFFSFKYRSCKSVTKIANKNLIELEEEFEQHRKNTLEREQKLRRKLQDEVNKQRGV